MSSTAPPDAEPRRAQREGSPERASLASDPVAHGRAAYPHLLAIPTRWMDNDMYGHVNNVTYYSYFDTVVNEHLIRCGGLDIQAATHVAFVVETSCRFHRSLSFPETIHAGLRVRRLGRSSVTYEIALFTHGVDVPAATGRFVHVWVERATSKPVDVPASIRAALAPLVVEVAA